MLRVEIPYVDPLTICAHLADEPWLAFLDSSARNDPRAAYSWLAISPYQLITASSQNVCVDGKVVSGTPFDVLQAALETQREHMTDRADMDREDFPAIPFRGGAIGFLGYELGRHVEHLPRPHTGTPDVPEMAMGLYDTVIAFDHETRRAFILATGAPESDTDARHQRARMRAEHLQARIAPALRPDAAPPIVNWGPRARFHPDRKRDEVENAIQKVIEYIRAGDIFQANLTQQMQARIPEGLSDFALYQRLRTLSPTPFAAFLRCGPELAVASASPERFLKLTPTGHIETRPIKGTRPRGSHPAEDDALAAELKASIKDNAENLMIVDLMRNDLSRVSRLGSVRVPVLCGLERFSSVHHLVSVIESQLEQGLGPVDLLRATFPGGSITGAPKIRAQQIIHELEPFSRGVYCGSVAWIGFDGAMDSSIVIRTITRVGATLLTHAGGGIVADSDPVAEYEESMVKLSPMLRALSGEGR
ncbi:aminodeoxychorismate synthase component I [Xanthobacter sp. TB0139]|uniref:aminodeoxychorismate synthase component I n=1 Tax=Xanthobacter sp. TB0139 TaxID=3459178 RepID=UPI004038FF88